MAQPEVIDDAGTDALAASVAAIVREARTIAGLGPNDPITTESILLGMLLVRFDMLAAGVSAIGSGGVMGMLGGLLGGSR